MVAKKLLSKDLNFFTANVNKAYDKNKSNRKAIMILAIFLAVVAVGYPSAVKYYNNSKLEDKIESIQEYLSSDDTNDKLLNAQENLEVLNNVKGYTAEVSSALEKFNALQTPSSEVFDTITSSLSQDITVDSMTYEEGLIILQCTSPDYESPPVAAVSLERSGAFEYVTYSGMIKNDDGTYSFSIECMPAEGGSVG